VFENIPEAMMKCFEIQDIGMPQQIFKELSKEEARYLLLVPRTNLLK